MKKWKFLVHTFLIGLLLFAGCKDKKPGTSNDHLVREDFPDKGDFILSYEFAEGDSYARMMNDVVQENLVVDHMVAELNRVFKLPNDVRITFKRAGEINAWYDPTDRTITFGAEMVNSIYYHFQGLYAGEELHKRAMNAVIFILFHEVGHALSDIYDLSVRAPEEDIVDNFSVFLLTTGNEQAEEAAIDGANYFYMTGAADEFKTVGSMPLWDVHALDKKRYFNIVALVYGKNPGKYNYFMGPKLLQAQDAERFVYNYQKALRSWRRDLSLFMNTL
jgi:hypothetical protein